jgi:hypothetical protein
MSRFGGPLGIHGLSIIKSEMNRGVKIGWFLEFADPPGDSIPWLQNDLPGERGFFGWQGYYSFVR